MQVADLLLPQPKKINRFSDFGVVLYDQALLEVNER
jgi:hypothetical protein